MRFHLDEHVDPAIASGLRLRGIDVTTTPSADLRGASDEKQLEFAWIEQRVIFTNDTDFLRLHSAGAQHHGIVFAAANSRSVGEVVRFLILLHDCVEEEQMEGRLEYF